MNLAANAPFPNGRSDVLVLPKKLDNKPTVPVDWREYTYDIDLITEGDDWWLEVRPGRQQESNDGDR